MKLEKDNAVDRAEQAEQQARDAALRAEKVSIWITKIPVSSSAQAPRLDPSSSDQRPGNGSHFLVIVLDPDRPRSLDQDRPHRRPTWANPDSILWSIVLWSIVWPMDVGVGRGRSSCPPKEDPTNWKWTWSSPRIIGPSQQQIGREGEGPPKRKSSFSISYPITAYFASY